MAEETMIQLSELTYESNNPLVQTASIEWIRENEKLKVDRKTEAFRLQFVTSGSAQAMVYQEKLDQATDFVAAGYPADVSPFPMLVAESEGIGQTVTDVADMIIDLRTQWVQIAASTEKIRRKAKTTMDTNTTIDDLVTTQSLFDQELALLQVALAS